MLKAIKKRRSHRQYQNKEVEDEKLSEILKAAMASPSAYHRYCWEFLIVKRQDLKDKLAEATLYASFVLGAPLIIVLCADEAKAYKWIEDCSIAAEHIYLEATNQGLGTCWVQIRGMKTNKGYNSEEYVRQILEIPKNIRVLCLMPVGYPGLALPEHDDSVYKKEKIHHEKW